MTQLKVLFNSSTLFNTEGGGSAQDRFLSRCVNASNFSENSLTISNLNFSYYGFEKKNVI